ncbi:MAG: universal stress protein [candidate division Zixibacteria bacterium]|nr:universal stress protein [candidate division Zixibacteria bacterium]
MKLLEKILLATDFSQASNDALQMAVFVAKAFRSRIIPIHVIPEIQDSPLPMEMVKETVTKRFEEINTTINKEGVDVAEPIVVSGTPFDQIMQHAGINDVNVIMVGSGEKEREGKFSLGITAERLIRRSNKPVWVVKRGTHPGIKKILCPVDFSETSARALTNAIHLARNLQAELSVMTVIQDIWRVYPTVGKAAAKKQVVWVKRNESEFQRFLQKSDFHDVNWNKVIREGNPPQEILSIARQMQADLLVMGSVGRTGLARILVGSVAEKVIRETPCSVITVKAEHAIRLLLEEEIASCTSHFKEGSELLEKGFPAEAIGQFQYCVDKDLMFAAAWDGLAAAHKRLGHEKESQRCTERAKYIRQRLSEMRVEAEARKQFWDKMR